MMKAMFWGEGSSKNNDENEKSTEEITEKKETITESKSSIWGAFKGYACNAYNSLFNRK